MPCADGSERVNHAISTTNTSGGATGGRERRGGATEPARAAAGRGVGDGGGHDERGDDRDRRPGRAPRARAAPARRPARRRRSRAARARSGRRAAPPEAASPRGASSATRPVTIQEKASSEAVPLASPSARSLPRVLRGRAHFEVITTTPKTIAATVARSPNAVRTPNSAACSAATLPVGLREPGRAEDREREDDRRPDPGDERRDHGLPERLGVDDRRDHVAGAGPPQAHPAGRRTPTTDEADHGDDHRPDAPGRGRRSRR